tara:strand:+ start:172 stop:465 length:294 start_codon:yes stop_codon:yes gene_type:complete
MSHRKKATGLYKSLDKITDDLVEKEKLSTGQEIDSGSWLDENHPDLYQVFIALDWVVNADKEKDWLEQFGKQGFLKLTKDLNKDAHVVIKNHYKGDE